MLASDVHLSVEGGVAIAQQRTREHELRLYLNAPPLARFACCVGEAHAREVLGARFSHLLNMGFDGQQLTLGNTRFPARAAEPLARYVMRGREMTSTSALRDLARRAKRVRFVHKPWGVLLDENIGGLIEHLIHRYPATLVLVGVTEQGVVLSAPRWSILFLDEAFL
jgi:hypothetical protein